MPARFPHILQGKKISIPCEKLGKKFTIQTRTNHIRRPKLVNAEKNAGNSGLIDAHLSVSFTNFPTEDSLFKEDFDFLVLPVFLPTDTLNHLKECGKATKKSTRGEAVAEM